MGKDPAFLFYPSDWDGGTKLFTRAEKGAYMDLLIVQFNCGHMTSQEIGHVLGQDFDSMWESRLKSKFKIDADGKYYNEKLENEQKRRKEFTESRRNNLSGNNQYGHKGGHTTSRMETVTVTVNKDIKDKEEAILSEWNGMAKQFNLATVLRITPKRSSAIKARLGEERFDFNQVMFEIKNSDFLKGKNDRDWKVDFDFVFCSPNNYIKILEGKYRNKTKAEPKSAIQIAKEAGLQ